ncbi:hypothetical protein PRIPAC_95670 [Pristionchus pacificus]|uniref:Uncharacterized protein n=1 Tax=Pristionchus pacificus TaxID=54126 RepID=A0A2A6D1X9_PRIPA|nr:hypothetical protein PRIPAC_95670 [Pristionchus pacificus]|eukprot:PDM84444.1 hypothetical protein PRIPAC_33467 [Pristionchus pacificus]
MIKSIPVLIEKFKTGRVTLRANPTLLDDSIARLSTAAQEPAKKFLDLMMSNEADLEKVYLGCVTIMDNLPDEVIEDLEAYKQEVAKIFGLLMPSSA